METDQDSDRRVEEAKASLMAHADELGRRFKDAREKMDIPAKIAEHPMIAVGAAVALGAFLGLLGGGARPKVVVKSAPALDSPEVKRGLMTMAGAALGSLVVQFAKDFAVRQLVNHASSWIDADQRAATAATEAGASRVPETESFFRH